MLESSRWREILQDEEKCIVGDLLLTLKTFFMCYLLFYKKRLYMLFLILGFKSV